MLRLPPFNVATPDSLLGVIDALHKPGARLIAGGTDLLPNLKHWLDRPSILVSLAHVQGLKGIAKNQDRNILHIAAATTLSQVTEHPLVQAHFPSLAQATGSIASPLIRNMGTIGGNINLDTRCRYVNQTEFWRKALGGGCLKSEGNVCHVVPKGRNCVAAMSSDSVPLLISLDADLVLVGPGGERIVKLEHYFQADGLCHTLARHGEITREVQIPWPSGPRRACYTKWSVRQSIDFPLISLALCCDLADEHSDADIREMRVVVGVLGAKPRIVKNLEKLSGQRLTNPEVAEVVSEEVYQQCKPLENVPYEASYRRQMLRVYARRAVVALAQQPGS